MIYQSQKKLALIAKRLKETKRFGRMIPNLDCDSGPQMIVMSGRYDDVSYFIRIEDVTAVLFVMKDMGTPPIYKNGIRYCTVVEYLETHGYDDICDEYDEIKDIVQAVNDNK